MKCSRIRRPGWASQSCTSLPVADIQWVVITYVLTFASLMLGLGQIGDMFGHRRLFRVGLLWSTGAYLLAAAAPSYGWLLVGRVAQGFGTALVLATGPALVTSMHGEAARPRLLGLYILRSRHNPKIPGRDDAKIIADGVA